MTPITLKRLEDTHSASIYYHGSWAGLIEIRALPTDDQIRIMNGETVEVELRMVNDV
jgi:hypothetical protein